MALEEAHYLDVVPPHGEPEVEHSVVCMASGIAVVGCEGCV